MNFLSHHEVARHVDGSSPLLAFGAMVPDFVGMFGVDKAYGNTNPGDLLAGVLLHQATDIVFDELPEIKELERDMSASFKEFMPKWTAVQCARVGKDILFDGIHFKNPEVIASYGGTMVAAANGRLDIAAIAEPEERWLAKLQAFEAAGLPDYSDTSIVALRLQRRLQGSRTAFDEDILPQLSDSLQTHQDTVMQMGSQVMQKVVAELND